MRIGKYNIQLYHQYHQITDHMLRCFRLSEHNKSFTLGNCQMDWVGFKHVVQELQGCKRLQHLYFFDNVAIFHDSALMQHLQWLKDIGEALKIMKSLKMIDMVRAFHSPVRGPCSDVRILSL